MAAGGTRHGRSGVALVVDPAVQVLQEGQVGGEQVLHDAGVHVVDAAQPVDDPAEQHHGQVGRILPDPIVVQRNQLVPGGGQPHDTVAVHGPGAST